MNVAKLGHWQRFVRCVSGLVLTVGLVPLAGLASTTWYVDGFRGSNGYSGQSSLYPRRTIQSAINSASTGDHILVAGGVYHENLTLSKRVTLYSYESGVAVVDGRHAGHCLLITEKASGCVVDGFVFTHGAPTNNGNKYGGGVDCLADATIRYCSFVDNGNASTTFAGGLHTSNRAQVNVYNCLFRGNYAWACGGASLTEGGSTATFDQCTVYGNRSDNYIGNQGGLSVANTGTIIVRNSILWGNTGHQIAAYGSYYGRDSTIMVQNSCVQGGVAANGAGHFTNLGGNISTDPYFFDIHRFDFRVRPHSPCYGPHWGYNFGWFVRPLPPPVWQLTITLDANGGECCVASVKRNVNDCISHLPVPFREGYDFLGWYTLAEGGRKVLPTERVHVNRTLHAQWQQKIPPLFEVRGKKVGIDSTVELGMNLEEGARDGKLYLNGELLTSTETASSTWIWQPQKLGTNKFVYDTGKSSVTTTVSVAKLTFATAAEPNPPMAKVPTQVITPLVRTIDNGGASKAILVSGSGTWTAAVSEPWIKLNATSGQIPASGNASVAYTVSVNTNIEERVGYVYVSGYVHEITQAGRAATISTDNITCETEGGSEDVTISFSGRYAWEARPNNDWITVSPTHGVGEGTVEVSVAPLNEVTTRTGTIVIGGQTVTVFQYGRRLKLGDESASRDYFAHVVPIDVSGLAVTTWEVAPNASWLSVVDAGRGKGSDNVTIAMGENPSYRARTGTVTIGTETFTVTQEGRTDLSFAIEPEVTTASVNGANGHIAVTGTPDLPWSVESKSNWLTVLGSTAAGTGNGNVFYTVTPNSTLEERVGTIVVTPADKSLPVKTHKVTQPGAVAVVSPAGYEFEAAGEAATITVTVPGAISWSVSESLSWLSVQGSTSRLGSGTIVLQATANDSIYKRSGTIKLAGRDFVVTQKGRGFELDYESITFGTDGDGDEIEVFPDGDIEWTATSSDWWIVLDPLSASGFGYGCISYTVAPYVGDGTPRTGCIQIGEQKIYVTQRAYDLSINPKAERVPGNAGAGEIAVSAGIGDVWNAIRTEPWIIIEEGYDEGTGNGTVRFRFTDNDTGKERSGKIIISGETYTLTQAARLLVNIDGNVIGHGTVSGAGTHAQGTRVTLTAVPDDGYAFEYWTGAAGETMQNPITVTADIAKSVTAHFAALTPEFISAVSSTEGVCLTWTNMAWAAEYRIYRAPSSEIPSAPLVTLPADGTCIWTDATGELEQTYWYWVMAVGADDTTESKDPVVGKKSKPIVISNITYTNLKGATHTNPATYQEETSIVFTAPSAVTGYAFAGWSPAQITASTSGDVTVNATWTANAYRIVYNANGGSGTMAATPCVYDETVQLAANAFKRTGYDFLGWAAESEGAVAYANGATVSNLTAEADGEVVLYAVWQANGYTVRFHYNFGDSDQTAEQVIKTGVTTRLTWINSGLKWTTPEGVNIVGWSTEPTATRAQYVNGETVTDIARAGEVLDLYVVWSLKQPTISKPNGSTFNTDSCTVSLSHAATGVKIYYTTNGKTPRETDAFLYKGPFVITETSTIVAVAVAGGLKSAYVESTVTRIVRPPLTLTSALGEPKLGGVATGGAANWTPLYDETRGADGMSVKSGTIGDEAETWLEATVYGAGTLTFWWKTDCEKDGRNRFGYDHASFTADGAVQFQLDGETGWEQQTYTFTTAGAHVVRWTYKTDDYEEKIGCAWVSGVTWSGSAAPTEIVVDDPSGKIVIPAGQDISQLTVKVMSHGQDIFAYLDLPPAKDGVIDLAQATIKAEFTEEVLDTEKGALIELNATSPRLTTANTRPGLVYTLREGTTLETMAPGASTVGNGQPWTPAILVKGGTSGFYSIEVSK